MFSAAMDAHAVTAYTTNGKPSVSKAAAGDPRCSAFFKLVRGLSREALKEHLSDILSQADGHEAVVDAFVLYAQTRDVRGGKGERDLARWWLCELSQRFPATVEALVLMVPDFGSWRDLTAFLEEDRAALHPSVRAAMLALYASQLTKDMDAPKPSLAGKWAPREGSAHGAVASELAKALFPDAKHPKPLYRKALAKINKVLGTVEVAMCAKEWSSISPGAVPSGCLLKKRKAFMNLPIKGQGARSDEADRVTCAAQFVAYAEECRANPKAKSMHGRALHPHQICAQYMSSGYGCEEDPILEAQWVDLRERLRAELSEGVEGASLGKMVPLVDVSGSMSGTPMEVAIALGILISEVAHPAVRDRFLTFESQPQWHQLQPEWSLKEKVTATQAAPWGGSTDFSKALTMLLDACVQGDVPPAEVGELQLVVLSDMQFDAAHGSGGYRYGGSPPAAWETQYTELGRVFKAAGLRSKYKEAYPVPRVIFWNLQGNTRDYPAASDTPGVDMVSGFSPSLLKLFLEGALDEVLSAVGLEDEPEKARKDPMDTVRKALDDERYRPVREACAAVGEGPMAGYVVPEPPEGEEAEEEFLLV
jgi:hypothetical protein